MADILHEFPIKAPPARVFQAFTQPEGLDRWYLEHGETVEYERRLDV